MIESRVCAWHIVSALPSLCSPFYCLIGKFDEGAGHRSVSVCTKSMDLRC